MVKWNEPYQKLASCDSTGIIFVWIKYEGRWSIELINDRNTPVTSFCWSHDGRMALICYQVGSSFYLSSLTEQHVRIKQHCRGKNNNSQTQIFSCCWTEFMQNFYIKITIFTKSAVFPCKIFSDSAWNCVKPYSLDL